MKFIMKIYYIIVISFYHAYMLLFLEPSQASKSFNDEIIYFYKGRSTRM